MCSREITIEDRIIENSAMNRLLDYVLATMEEMQRRKDDEETQNQETQSA